MRLHSLEITAFGPFAETATVDFDSLSEASVFLLCGDTGAGKTTVLDAVCFAFYGDVPSERSAAKQLRSHHAPDGAVPRVVLETTLSGRRFRLTRSPQWRRPKRRGTGVTTEQARVLVEELVGGEWVSRTNRLDEAGHLVTDLLGMNLGQFSQVVLLPQGQFDTFLRATSDERHAVLTQLFRTRRFEEVERWLVDRRTSLRRSGETHEDAVTALLHRVSEATGTDLPAEWASSDLGLLADDGQIEAWTSVLAETVAADVDAAEALQETSRIHLETALTAHDHGRRVDELRARHARATRVAGQLAATADAAAEDRRRLAAARRAAVVRPLVVVAEDASAASGRAASAAARAIQAVAHALPVETGDLDDAALAERERDATQRAAVARSFLPRARELTAASGRLMAAGKRIETMELDRRGVVAQVEAMPTRIAELVRRVTLLRNEANEVAATRLRVTEVGRRLASFAIAAELEFQVADFTAKRDVQREVTVTLREEMVSLRERRMHGMAAELASAMAVGQDCPVCGSHEHPAPARPSPGSPTKADEQVLRNRIDDAEVLLETHNDQVRGYQARLAAVLDDLGPGTSDEALAELTRAEQEHASARQSADDLVATERELDQATRAERELSAALGSLDADLRVAREQQSAAAASVAALRDQLAEILGSEEGESSDLDELIVRHEHSAALLTTAREALAEQFRRGDRAHESAAAAAGAAEAQGFADVPAALAAVLHDGAAAELETRIHARERAETEASLVLAEPAVRAAATVPAPDLVALRRTHEEATQAHTRAASALRLALQRRERLLTRLAELGSALASWAPQRADYAVVRSLAELVEGKGADNTRQMRLSAYVLSARLSQVVSAANERLSRMTDDRYLLEHTARRGVGERRGGLSLLVRDQWTDERRDPVTLSGGETFVVSLALALGLADVVTGEAGGARVETLFVDEGFGSLDSDTLELVMDTLDQLREGGRVVGVVSHVPELRTRIPAQLVVHKTRVGSTLEQRLGVG
jgi:exonuclease SbcC